MFNGSNNGMMASRQALDPYGYDSEDEDTIYDQSAASKRAVTAVPLASKGSSKLDKKYGIGAKLLSKMGYVEGQGLGKNGSGIANPIQVTPRANASVGLGMLSQKRAKQHEAIGSSDEEQGPRSHNPVAFNKTATETLSEDKDKLEQRHRRALKQRFSELQCELRLSLSPELLDNIDTASLDEIKDLENLTEKLLKNQKSCNSLEHRIRTLELETTSLKDEATQLAEINKDMAAEGTHSLLDGASKILSLSDRELVDKFISQLLRRWFSTVASSNAAYEELLELVEVLQYQMDAATSQLNRSQTQIHKIIFDWYSSRWQEFTVDKEHTSLVILTLLDLEPVLKFIGCFEYVLEKFIYPRLLNALETWEIVHSGEFPPRLWIFDFMVVVNQSMREKFEDIVADKLTVYFDTWYHRDSPLISRPDLIFIQELLGQRYVRIIRDKFLPEFIKQLWDKHFDPLMELEDSTAISPDEGSIYYVRTLLTYRHYFDQKVFDTLLKAVFNEYNKILYQWLLYSTPQDGKKAKYWFFYIVNEIFRDSTPLGPELTQIRQTLTFLDSAAHKPMHDESLDLLKDLDIPHKDDMHNDESVRDTVQNIPMRKVSATFKSVVEDFCSDNGFLMEKLQNQYAQLPYGLNGDSLVPLFRLSRGNTSHYVAMNDDILWLEKGKGKFIPTYLYELK